MLIEKTQIERWKQKLEPEIKRIQSLNLQKKILFLNQSNVLLNHSRIFFHKFNHDFRLQWSITPNMNIII
jgi:hypothetical protein